MWDCLFQMRTHGALLEKRQGYVRMQEVPFSYLVEKWDSNAQVQVTLQLLVVGLSFNYGNQKGFFNRRNTASTWSQALSADLAYGSQDKGMHGQTG